MEKNKLIWRIVHQLHKLPAFVDNGSTVPPGEGCGEKSCDLYILLLSILMWYCDRIVIDESRPVIFLHLSVKKGLQLLLFLSHLSIVSQGLFEIFNQVFNVFDPNTKAN